MREIVLRGIMDGYPDGKFLPDGTISREEFAAVVSRATGLFGSGSLDSSESPYFDDVSPTDWSYEYIQALAEMRILHPEDYGAHLSPHDAITRQEIAIMLVRAGGFETEAAKTAELTTFTDAIPAWSKGHITVALNHGLIAGYEDSTFRPSASATRAEAGLMVLRLLDPKVRPATWVETYRYEAKSSVNTLSVVRVNFNRDDIDMRPAMAGTVRENAYLADIAQGQGAIAAINGGYFSAYSNDNGDFREPFNALAIDGRWLHFQYQGTALGITRDKEIIMDAIRMSVNGSTDGVIGAWTAWSVNHTAPDIIGIFTPERGETTGMADGITFTVRNGRVVSKGGPDVSIPKDGYVIFVSNTRVNKWTDTMFPIGAKLDFTVNFFDHNDTPHPRINSWRGVLHAVGCGPRLVTDGVVTVNPQAEGYTEAKQTTMAYNRSGVGVTIDNIVAFVTCTSLTPQEFGEAMADLGSENAMQMDSGASSCLWYDGEYLASPGRMISNALVVIKAE